MSRRKAEITCYNLRMRSEYLESVNKIEADIDKQNEKNRKGVRVCSLFFKMAAVYECESVYSAYLPAAFGLFSITWCGNQTRESIKQKCRKADHNIWITSLCLDVKEAQLVKLRTHCSSVRTWHTIFLIYDLKRKGMS